MIPGAPTGVTATATSGQVTLSWTAPSGGAASYMILRSTSKGSGYSAIGTTASTSFANTGLTNGVLYYYVVQASNGAACNSGYSREKACGGGTYCDDFESGAAPNWTVSNGTFAVSLASGNYVYQQTQTGSTTAGRYAYKTSSVANYTVQARVRVTQFGNATSSSRAGVAARYNNATTSYTFGLAGNNTLTLQKGYATAISNCAAIAFTVGSNTWYTLKIVVSGTSLKTYVDGVLKHSCTDSGVTAANKASLFTGSGGTPGTLADFDDVLIY
jgi:fibronectin type 3 domain-containing protein